MTMNKILPTNKEIIDKYLNHYGSEQSKKVRKSSLNYFFGINHFNYQKHVFKIDTMILTDYFDFLNNLPDISFITKRNKWHIITSFLNSTMEYYEKFKFVVRIPKFNLNWNVVHKKAKSNKRIIATIPELELILQELRKQNLKHYLIFRLFIETGMRKGELITAKLSNLHLNKRYINGIGKTGDKIYFFSEGLRNQLKILVNERKKLNVDFEELFLTHQFKPYGARSFNLKLKYVRDRLGIKKNITCHTFRRTINTLRKKLKNCPNEYAKILLGHKVQDVNIESYTIFDIEDQRNLYDKYNPYNSANF